MKKVFLMFITCFISIFSCFACTFTDKPITVNNLPEQAKVFVTTHFKGANILYVEKDNDFRGVKYDVHLNNGVEITFDKKGNWDKVDMNTMTAVPNEIIPMFIKKYVEENFKNSIITKIDKERWGYEIEVNDNIEIKFDHKGQVIGFDD